jgi:putative restriction endonuclease
LSTSLGQRIQELKVWKQGGKRAPHKPLLVLLALGRVATGAPRLTSFEELAPELTRLLRDFGPPRKRHHPEYPFWRLQRDGIWEVTHEGDMRARTGSTDHPRSELLRAKAAGGFTPEIHRQLDSHPAVLQELAGQVLEQHFPESLWPDLLAAIGLERRSGRDRRRRTSDFRIEVLRAYRRCCAVCGFDLRIGDELVGLEAAHIRWHAFEGPDQVPNGLALCSLHHKLFDRGAFTLDENLELLASEEVTGGARLEDWLIGHHGQGIRAPQREEYRPLPEYLAWHQREVFRGPPRARRG